MSNADAMAKIAAFKAKVEAMKAAKPTSAVTTKPPANSNSAPKPKLLFLGSEEDKSYASHLKSMVGLCDVFVRYTEPATLLELVLYCKQRGVTGVFTTSQSVLTKLLSKMSTETMKPSVDNYAGSYFSYDGIEIVIIHPLKNFMTVPYQKFLTQRFISKLSTPEVWHDNPEFNFELLTASNFDRIFNLYSSAFLIAIDIETKREDLAIDCIGYSAAIHCPDTGKFIVHSCVLPLDSIYAVSLMRRMNWELQAPKVFQNGKYDCLYLARWSAPVYNYLYDTVNMFHCWYCEMPKDLGFITAFFVRKVQYWKDLAQTNDKYEYYKYNALDTFGTLLAAIEWLLQAPQWAKNNYLMEFPVVFPAHMCELTGLKQDSKRLNRAASVVNKRIEYDNICLSKMVGTYPQIFNVNSAPQNKALRTILGAGHIVSSDEKSLKKIGALHPLNSRITNKILDIRGDRKLVSTYLVIGKDLNGRILYSLNPHGTDSGRLASRESAFWCGLQIQNIPAGKSVKQTITADTNFRLCECDSSKAETWDTAYLSGDKQLITAVNSPLDFHKVNASAFFGMKYEEVTKAIRNLAKRVNHGANYLMGEGVLVDTMGEPAIWEAKRLLKLPQSFGLLDVAKHLLESFHATYPTLRAVYYPSVVSDVVRTRLLVGAQGWTRYCFGSPDKNKLDKNSYVAHRSQSENAMRLNRAFMRVFYEIAMDPKHRDNFKLCAQIHDSILFQYRIGHEYLCDMVKECMELPVTVKSADGVVRTYTVPADLKNGKDNKGALRWSLTE